MNTLVTFNPIAVSAEESLARVVRLMEEHELHHLPVVDDGFRLLGIISDFDVARNVDLVCRNEGRSEAGEAAGLPTAGEIMTRDVTALEADSSPAVVLQQLVSRNIHSVPMLRDGRIQGIVTSTDFLREFGELAPVVGNSPIVRVMSPWRGAVDVDSSTEDALRSMTESRVDYLGVSDCGRPVGAISVRTLRRARRLQWMDETGGDELMLLDAPQSVGSLLDHTPGVIAPTCSVGSAAALLFRHRNDALAVVDPHGTPKGLLTEADLMRALFLAMSARN